MSRTPVSDHLKAVVSCLPHPVRRAAGLVLCLISIWLPFPLKAQDAVETLEKLTYMTESYPPYQYEEDGELTGLYIELLDLAFKEIGLSKSAQDLVRIVPWARAYKRTLNLPNSALVGIVRSPMREELFQWVGPFSETSERFVIVHRLHEDVEATSHPRGSFRIATVRGDITLEYLERAGIGEDETLLTPDPDSIIDLIRKDRVHYWAYGQDVIEFKLNEADLLDEFEITAVLGDAAIYIAANHATDKAALKLLQQAMDKVRKSPEAKVLHEKYGITNTQPVRRLKHAKTR
ncbi:substrate-binding periplasmic protein [Kiloniella sp. b19]|uniref:substrate-binding periplasmic protein n=1 Tax=Kiloniella sp. GXU_MW_B19 TaxID=3141326 RepID=UPI0031D644A2